MIKSQLAAAFVIETAYRTESDPVLLMDERLNGAAVSPSEVTSRLKANDTFDDASAAAKAARMVLAWDGLRHVFRPRSALDQMCRQLASGGRLIYAQRLVDQYVGLTAKWLLDYFVTAQYADCRVYVLWPPEQNPAVATFDYQWMLAHARPVYNPMWDNITHAEAVVVVAEKGAESRPGVPSQDNYRPAEEWKRYAETLARLAASSRPWHLSGPAPATLPAGYRAVLGN